MKNPLHGKDRIKLLYIRPPSHLWPIINESDNFLPPLNFPSLAAYIRRETTGIEQKIIDCMPHKIGWKSLYKVLADEKPDVVAVGDMIVYAHEGMRACRMAKELNPQVVTIGGGVFHSHMPEYSFNTFPHLDYIVRYEGEETLRELLETLRDGKDVGKVRGIAYRKGDKVVETPPRPLIEDLDSLPIPAYDMIPIEKYAPFGMLWPKAVTVQSNRGCPYTCEFCSWSVTEGEHYVGKDGKVAFRPRIRLKSPERMVEEVALLYEKHKVRYLFWVDATWNFDSRWLDKFCSELIRRRYKLGWWAFVRADLMLQQEKAGVLKKMVKAGLRHCLFGAERSDEAGMKEIGKDKATADHFFQASHLLEKKYPEVFRQACFLVGLPSETSESIAHLSQYVRDSHVDFPAIHPIMPYPGTPAFDRFKDRIREWDFSKWDMFFPIVEPYRMTRDQVSEYAKQINLDFINKNPQRYIAGMFSPHPIRRRLYWWFLISIGRVVGRDLVLSLLGKKQFEGFSGINRLWKPSWYDD
ncbi:MAG: radical SAM protein [Deltaproteobacteria bacterium]|nr:radical SAM protein [Deltaproteobacteria bacterium]